MIRSYVSIDLETTGLNPKLDKIIEIGAVKVVDGQVQDTFWAFVNPGRRLGEKITALTGLRDELLQDALQIGEVAPSLFSFLEDYPLLGHRVLFDFSFLKKAAVDQRLSFEKKGIDTLKIAKKYLGELEHRNLDYLCSYYGIAHEAHRALGDAQAASALYEKLVRQFYDPQEEVFCPFVLQYQAKRDTPAAKSQKERLYSLIERHKLMVDVDVEKLTRSEASRLTDKILARYGR